MQKPKGQAAAPQSQIDTDGGAFIGGNVDTGGGDFVGRDKIVKAEKGGVAIGGNVTGSTIVTGDHNVMGSQVSLQEQYIEMVFHSIETHPDLSRYEKDDLKANLIDIQKQDAQQAGADEGFIAHRLRNIQKMAPEIMDVALATIANPVVGFGSVAKKVAEKIKAQADKNLG